MLRDLSIYLFMRHAPICGSSDFFRSRTSIIEFEAQEGDQLFIQGILSSALFVFQRDGGGPLVCQDDSGKWVLYGLTALGLDMCRFGDQAPSIFVDVGKYIDWIIKTGFLRQATSSLSTRNTPIKQANQQLILRANVDPTANSTAGGKTDIGASPHVKLFSNRLPQTVPLMKPLGGDQKRTDLNEVKTTAVNGKRRFPVEI